MKRATAALRRLELEQVVENLKRNLGARDERIRELERQLECATTPQRQRLAPTRASRTHRLRIGVEKLVCPACDGPLPGTASSAYLTTGFYEDGRVGEVFLTLDRRRRGDLTAGFAHAWALAVSVGLQHGVPLQVYAEKLRHTRDVSGGAPLVQHPESGALRGRPELPMVGSLIDYVAWGLEQTAGAQESR